MARTIKDANLKTAKGRSRLKKGPADRNSKPIIHWRSLIGKTHLGWECRKGEPAGRWLLRRYLGKATSANGKPVARYTVAALDRLADDTDEADGVDVLSFEQAEAMARAMAETPHSGGKIQGITVRQAFDRYIKDREHDSKPIDDIIGRANVHILPFLGGTAIEDLTADKLKKWRSEMAAGRAQSRPRNGQPQYRQAPTTDDAKRARRASANRVWTILRAALNHAFRTGQVTSDIAWRQVKPFEKVDKARVRYLTVAEADRLLNACDADFCPLVRAALETGCRYSELTQLEIADFNPDAGTVTIRTSKSGKSRHVSLTPEGADFFRQHCAGRGSAEFMFKRGDGTAWNKSVQARPMREACGRARITPPASFHALRHTWASLAAMNGVPLMVVAKNLGHVDTRMVEKHYGHLAPSYIAEAIHAGAPRFAGADTPSSIVPMPSKKSKSRSRRK